MLINFVADVNNSQEQAIDSSNELRLNHFGSGDDNGNHSTVINNNGNHSTVINEILLETSHKKTGISNVDSMTTNLNGSLPENTVSEDDDSKWPSV